MRQILFLIVVFFSITWANSQPNWAPQNTPTNEPLKSVHFSSLNFGCAVGPSGLIITTNNGGYTWEQQNSGSTQDLFDCQFIDEQNGWACGNGGVVLRTNNGGTSWLTKVILAANEFYAIDFFNNTSGYVAGKNTLTGLPEIYYTTNGGGSFTGIAPPSAITDIIDIEFFDLFSGYVLSSNGLLHYTTDQGFSWIPVSIPGGIAFTAFEMTDFQHGWIVGPSSSIYYTSTGTSWNPQSVASSADLYDVCIVDAAHAFACGQNGVIVSTSNGTTWSEETNSDNQDLYSISSIDPDNGWASGANGTIVHQDLPSNAVLELYQGPTSVCPLDSFQVSVEVKNGGLNALHDGNFKVFAGASQIIDFNWTGNILPGYVETIILGSSQISQNTILTVAYTGDDVSADNELVSFVNTDLVTPYGVTEPITACAGEQIEFSAWGGNSYHWLNASADSLDPNQTLIALSDSLHIVTIYQTNCIVMDTVMVTIGGALCATNAFSPNGDGVNDFFFIDALPASDNTVIIFGRWGNEIISFTNYNNQTIRWEGHDSTGESVVEGVYFYTVSSPTNSAVAHGWVQVIR